MCTDIHFGAKANSDLHNNDCLRFIQWFIETAKSQGCDTCLFLGDYHNNRNTMNLKTMNYAITGLELLSENFDHTYFIPGNHDLFFKDNRRIYSTPWVKHMSNITIVNEWFNDGDVIIAPWLVGDDHKKIKKLSGKYMFGHFELPGFYMNSQVKMPDNGEVDASHFKKVEHCFSGHFHKRQTNKNITYIGNAFPHNYSDAGDDERGMMVLEWGEDPVFLSWPEQPTFRTLKLSELLQEDAIILPNQYIRASVDVELSFEESAFIKEKFIADYGIRELVLVPERVTIDTIEEDSFVIEPIDKTIVSQLTRIDSDTYDKSLLVDIYTNL